jgi:glutathione S-transferase
MTSPLVLFYAPDNASLIIRLALEELGLPYETRLVDRRIRAQDSPEYLAVNPTGLIPTLMTPEGPVSETAAILLWLTETTGRLAPAPGSAERPAFLNWLLFTANTLHADLIQIFYIQRYGPDAALPDMRRAAQARVQRHLRLLDGVAARQPSWLGGAEPSVLDFYLCALLRWAALYPDRAPDWFRLSDTPALAAIATRIEARPATAAAIAAEGLGPHPFTNPDYANPPEGSTL